MIKVKATLTTNWVGTDTEEVLEFDDGTSDEDIEAAVREWAESVAQVETEWVRVDE